MHHYGTRRAQRCAYRAPEGKMVTRDNFDLYDDGIPQEIESFSRLDAGS